MSPTHRSPPVFSLSWVLILGIALAVGGAAALLTASTTAPSSSSPPATLLEISGTTLDWIVVFGAVGIMGFLIFDRLRQGAVPIPTRVLAVALAMIVLLTIFAVAGRFIGGGSLPPLTPANSGSNETSSGGNTSNQGANLTGPGGNILLFGFSLPPWILFALVAAVALIGVVLAVRVLGTRVLPKIASRSSPSDGGARELFVEASAALDAEEDPRGVLIRLYGLLLERLTPLVGDTDPQTAEEIRVGHLMRLGTSSETAREITRLFEEARYSTHSIGPAELARAKSAIHRAIVELDAKGAYRT